MRIPRRAAAVLGIAAAFLFVAAAFVWRTDRVLRNTDRSITASQFLPITTQVFVPPPNPGFEALSAPAFFRSAAAFRGRIYLSGSGGLFVYADDGSLQHIYRPGIDLPAVPLGNLAIATVAGNNAPELLIATAGEGVLAFDGHRLRQIRPAVAENRNVTALLALSSGRLLLGTAKSGLLVFDGKTLQRFHPTTSNLYITALAGTESDLWIGTLDSGLIHWRGGQAKTISEADGLPDRRVESIAVGESGVYAATPAGVAELRGGRITRVLAHGNYAHTLLITPEALFVGQLEGGIVQADFSSVEGTASTRRAIAAHADSNAPSPQQSDAPIEQFFRIGDTPYAVSGNQLLRSESGNEWRGILQDNNALLTDGNISSLMVASDGRIWIGYFDRGLDILPATGGPPVHIENAHVFCVNRILENPRQGTVAVATANGLVLFDRDGRQKQVLMRDSGLIASHVTDVAIYGDGLAAGTPAGITFLDSSGPHSLYAFQGLVNNHVYALGTSGNGLLAGTLGGISLISGGEVRRSFNTANSGLKANWTTALVPLGADWLAGTYGAGIFRIDADGSVSPTEATAQGTVINPGAMVSDGRLVLAGTLGKGLLVGDAGGTRWQTVTAGLPSLNVTALAVRNGIVYVGTDNGLVKIAEDKL